MSRNSNSDFQPITQSLRERLTGIKQPVRSLMNANLTAYQRSVDVLGSDYISCPSHVNYFITNMCVNPDCVEPLCAECINPHLIQHDQNGTHPQIENIHTVRQVYREQVQGYLRELERDLTDIENHDVGDTSKDRFLQFSMKKLDEAKFRVLSLVDDVFNDISHQLKVKISKQFNLLGEFQTVREHLMLEIQKVQRVLSDFDSPIDYVKATIYSVEKQIGSVKNPALNDLRREIEHYESQLPDVSVDVRALDEMYEVLNNYVQIIQQVSTPHSTQSRQPAIKSPVVLNPKNVRFEEEPALEPPLPPKRNLQNNVYMTRPPRTESISSQPNFATTPDELRPMSAYPSIRIETQHESPFICNFVDDQKFGLLWQFNANKMVEVVELDVENRLPHNHGSAIVQDQIFLIGGIVKDFDRNNAVSSVYKVALKQKRVQLIGNMINRRQSFGLAVMGAHTIYVVGGSLIDNESQGISHFEKMDVQTKRWAPLTPAKFKATGCSLVAFHEKFLIKFGGLDPDFKPIQDIEIYNVKRDNWYLVKTFDHNDHLWVEVPSKAGAVQINKDQILIFGGQYHDAYTEDCWLGNIDYSDEIAEIRVHKTHSLPFMSEVKFPIVSYKQRIYAYISRPEKSSANNKRRTLVECSSEGWSQLG